MTEWAALIAWVLTAGGGIVMLAISLSRGGMLLLVVAGLGFFMLSIWAGQRQARATVAQAATATSGPARPAEQRFPVAFVATA